MWGWRYCDALLLWLPSPKPPLGSWPSWQATKRDTRSSVVCCPRKSPWKDVQSSPSSPASSTRSVEKRHGEGQSQKCGARHHLSTLADCRFWGQPWAEAVEHVLQLQRVQHCSSGIHLPTRRRLSSPLLLDLPKVTAFGHVVLGVDSPVSWINLSWWLSTRQLLTNTSQLSGMGRESAKNENPWAEIRTVQ